MKKTQTSERQKKTFDLVTKKGMSMRQAMIKAGYTESTAGIPGQLTKKKSWKELVAKYLPDDLLAERHNQLLNAKKIKKTYIKGDLVEVVEEIDRYALAQGLNLAYKLKGAFAPEKIEVELNLTKILDAIQNRSKITGQVVESQQPLLYRERQPQGDDISAEQPADTTISEAPYEEYYPEGETARDHDMGVS